MTIKANNYIFYLLISRANMAVNMTTRTTGEVLVEILLEDSLCSSSEEANAIVESILEDQENNNNNGGFLLATGVGFSASDEKLLMDYLDVNEEMARSILSRHELRLSDRSSDEDKSDEEDSEEDDEEELDDGEDFDEDLDLDLEEEEIAEGECELCERSGIKLTRHHLIPKETWKRLQSKLKYACENSQEYPEKVYKLLDGTTLMECLPAIYAQNEKERRKNNKKGRSSCQQPQPNKRVIKISTIRNALFCYTTNICRQCHSAVHGTHDNMTLALQYNTRELLLNDLKIAKFCAWANKQKRIGKYSKK